MPNDPYIPFSQREGLEPVPPQLKLGEVSMEWRRLLDYYVGQEIEQETANAHMTYLRKNGKRVWQDVQVLLMKKEAQDCWDSPFDMKKITKSFSKKEEFHKIFDFVEFLLRHQNVSHECKQNIAGTFEQCRLAYRVVDNMIVAVGGNEQAAAFVDAIEAAKANHANAARQHLVAAGNALKNGDWAGSVRESIHAVEAVARKLSPEARTLAPALTALEKKGYLHGSLKGAFNKLYGYTNDEEGVRHALVFNETTHVDEADALFMLGACASFVSYLLARMWQAD